MSDTGINDYRIPVTLLTGFLGAGKTTLLNHLLHAPGMERAAVLINEFGEVGVDHHLVDKVDDNIMLLESGCICCAVQGDLARALRQLFMRGISREIAPVSRVLIETTGLADPAPVIHTLMEDPFIAQRYRCDGVVTAVSATHGADQLAGHAEAVRQVAVADRLLVTKCDLAEPAEIEELSAGLAELNPGAEQVRVSRGEVAPEAVFGLGLYDPTGKAPDVAAWLAEERILAARRAAEARRYSYGGKPAASHAPARHDGSVSSYVLTFDEPFDWFQFGEAMGILLSTCGDRILRVKGLVNVAGDPLPRVVQCVGHVAYPPTNLAAWPETAPYNDRRSRLVFIVRELDRSIVEHAFACFCKQRGAGPA